MHRTAEEAAKSRACDDDLAVQSVDLELLAASAAAILCPGYPDSNVLTSRSSTPGGDHCEIWATVLSRLFPGMLVVALTRIIMLNSGSRRKQGWPTQQLGSTGGNESDSAGAASSRPWRADSRLSDHHGDASWPGLSARFRRQRARPRLPVTTPWGTGLPMKPWAVG